MYVHFNKFMFENTLSFFCVSFICHKSQPQYTSKRQQLKGQLEIVVVSVLSGRMSAYHWSHYF